MRLIQTLLLAFILLIVSFNYGFSQDSNDTKRFQIDLTIYGISRIKKPYDGATSGLGFTYKHDFWLLSAQILSTSKLYGLTNESNGFYNFDVLGGFRYNYKRIELSISSGASYVYRRAGDLNIYFNSESSAYTIGLPVRGKMDFWISKRFAIGLLGYYCANRLNSIYGLSLNLGFRF